MKKLIMLFLIVAAVFILDVSGIITMNYTILSMLFIVGAIFIKKWKPLAEVMFALAVVLVCLTMKNYFQADAEVYSNSDHHAVRVDGYTFVGSANGYLLAANSENALLDNEKFNGQLSIESYDANGVTLRLTGFTQSLYADKYDDLSQQWLSSNLLNPSSLLTFAPSDTIELVGYNNASCKLWLQYNIVKDSCLLHKGETKAKDCSCNYIVQTSQGIDTLLENRIIRKGLDLNTIMGGVSVSGLSTNGINFVRQKTTLESPDLDTLSNKDLAIEFDYNALDSKEIKEINIIKQSAEKERYVLSDLKRRSHTVKLEYGQAFSVGCLGDLKTSSMKFELQGDTLSLKYVTPKYHNLSSLNDVGLNTIFVTASLNSEVIADRGIPESIMMYDLFENENNKNIFQPFYLSYVSGATNQELEFQINNTIKIEAGESIPNLRSDSGRILWNMQIEDFKASARHLQENNIILFIIILGICIIASIYWYRLNFPLKEGFLGQDPNEKDPKTRTSALGTIEIMAYWALLLFFSFRLLLMWRGAVFPPGEQASIYEFNQFFRNEEIWFYQFGALNTFFVAIYFLKEYCNRHRRGGLKRTATIMQGLIVLALIFVEVRLFDLQPIGWEFHLIYAMPIAVLLACIFFINIWSFKINDWLKNHKRFWIIFFVAVISWFAAEFIDKAVFTILIPLCTYLLLEVVIWKNWHSEDEEKSRYKYEPHFRNELPHFSIADIFNFGFGYSLINGLLYTIVLLLLDGGYGVIFFAFFLFSTALKLYDFYRSYYTLASDDKDLIKKYNKQSLLKVGVILAFAFVCILLFVFFKDVLAGLFLLPIPACIVIFSIVVALFILGLIYVLSIKLTKMGLIGVVASAIVIGSFLSLVTNEKFFTNHTAQRIIVQIYSPEQGLLKTQTASEERRFFEASTNDYILNVYNRRGDEVSYFGSGGKGYFKLQPHSRIGAMFGAQGSDILTARFIVSEHGTWLFVLFLVIYLIMLYYGVVIQARYRASKMLLMQIPLLLFLQSLFVWMANTQLFIFLGQDVPLFSLHSKLSVMLYLILTAVWVCVAIIDRLPECREIPLITANQERVYTKNFAKCILVGFFIGVVFLCGFYIKQDEKFYTDRAYSLETLMEQTIERYKNVDSLFEEFQKEIPEDSLNKIVTNINDVSNLISKFNRQYNAEIKKCLGSEFEYRIWERFAEKGGAKHNTSTALLHVRKNSERYFLSIRKAFYDRELPSVGDNKWRGSIIADPNQGERVRSNHRVDGIRQYILPKDWVNQSEKVAILVNESGNSITLRSGDSQHATFEMTPKGYTSACQRFAKDQHTTLYKMQSLTTFYARNVVINGRRDFIYPMGKDFFWVYTFANQVKAEKRELAQDLQDDDLPKDFHADIPITIDKDLTLKLRGELKSSMSSGRTYASVIVADGDGQIRAMVDYRRGGYEKMGNYSELNPNDMKKLAKISEELYMNSIYKVDEAYFGNINLMHIPGGPGSSQKPIVWTAVASGIDFDWKKLNMVPIIDKIPIESKYFVINQFNGDQFNAGFSALRPDENNGNGVTLSQYMSHSSNYYNALMLYIGAFNSPNMDISRNIDGNSMFTEIRAIPRNKETFQNAFPIMEYKGKIIRLNQKLPDSYTNSLLLTRMNSMFGFDIIGAGYNRSLYPSIIKRDKGNSYVCDKNSQFNFKILDDHNHDAHDYPQHALSQRIHQPAVGGAGIWQVTPLFMAQCFGRLAVLKSNYNLSLEPADERDKEYRKFEDLSGGYKNARGELLKGMNDLKTLGVFDEIKDLLGASYHVYAKTGTSNEPKTEKSLLKTQGISNPTTNLHRLGLVITNKDLTETSVECLKDVKFYTIYFTTRQNLGNTYKEVVKKVIESDTFKEYMRGNEQ